MYNMQVFYATVCLVNLIIDMPTSVLSYFCRSQREDIVILVLQNEHVSFIRSDKHPNTDKQETSPTNTDSWTLHSLTSVWRLHFI